MKAQKTLKTLILTLSLVATIATIASSAMAAEVNPAPVTDTTVTVPAAPTADGVAAPATVRVVQSIMDESAANSDTYCVYEQRQFCNYYGCFYQWQYVCYPW